MAALPPGNWTLYVEFLFLRDFKRDAGRLRTPLTPRMHFRNAGVSPALYDATGTNRANPAHAFTEIGRKSKAGMERMPHPRSFISTVRGKP
jgi:hypothetical protein